MPIIIKTLQKTICCHDNKEKIIANPPGKLSFPYDFYYFCIPKIDLQQLPGHGAF